VTEAPAQLADLKTDTTTTKRGFGQRFRGWLFGEKTG